MSPLSTISLNVNATPATERKASYDHASPKPIAQDNENTYPQSPEQPPSSPFVEDVIYSPAKRRTLSSTLSPVTKQPKSYESVRLTEDALRENEGLTNAAQDTKSNGGSTYPDGGEDAASAIEGPSGYPGMDDTHFTAFSAVQNTDMTAFARLGQSPFKNNNLTSPIRSPRKGFSEETPRRTRPTTPASRRRQSYEDCSPSPTPRRPQSNHGDTTNLLVDFTEQFSAFASHARSSRPSPKKSQTQPNLAQYTNGLRTPSPAKHALPPGTPSEARHLANLLDFDLPPAPTPRSIPTITAREVESLKSSFLSQISSLRATLSGKEAEVAALKEAVGDAERRVGEAMEELRDERGTREQLQAGKLDWEKRDKEMQDVLRGVKEEIMRESREKEQLRQNLEESERKREEAEARAIDAESKVAGLRTPSNAGSAGQGDSRKEVDAAVERVAQELHGLYKTKHEDKVKALKKSYQARWEKKIHDLESRLDEATRENEELRLGRDATISGVVPSTLATASAENEAQAQLREQERAVEAQRYEEQAVKLKGLEAQVQTVKNDNEGLLKQLEAERVEMAELVAATEEMMQLSTQTSQSVPSENPSRHGGPSDSLRGPLSRSLSSGLKAPSAGFGSESKIGRMHTGASGDTRSQISSGAGRSGIMRNIERMGSHRGSVD